MCKNIKLFIKFLHLVNLKFIKTGIKEEEGEALKF